MKFCLVRIDPKRYPNLKPCWYRKITDPLELQDHCGTYCTSYYRTVFSDGHFEAALEKGDAGAVARHPMVIMPKRIAAMFRCLTNEGIVLVGRSGGWCFPLPGSEILEEKESDKWPVDEVQQRYEYVKIGKWPLGNHYYLKAWPRTLPFSKDKYNTYEEAFEEAKRFVPEDHIEPMDCSQEKMIYPQEGD